MSANTDYNTASALFGEGRLLQSQVAPFVAFYSTLTDEQKRTLRSTLPKVKERFTAATAESSVSKGILDQFKGEPISTQLFEELRAGKRNGGHHFLIRAAERQR